MFKCEMISIAENHYICFIFFEKPKSSLKDYFQRGPERSKEIYDYYNPEIRLITF